MSAIRAKVSAADCDASDRFLMGRKLVINRSNNDVRLPATLNDSQIHTSGIAAAGGTLHPIYVPL